MANELVIKGEEQEDVEEKLVRQVIQPNDEGQRENKLIELHQERIISKALEAMKQEILDPRDATLLRGELGLPPPIPRIYGIVGRCSPPYKKILTRTDVNDGDARFLIEKSFAEDFINPLLWPNENLVQGVDVFMYDHNGRAYAMAYKIWAEKLYVLTTNWKRYYRDNNLRALADRVWLWAFRRSQAPYNLCFAIMWERLSSEEIYQNLAEVKPKYKRKRKY